jgi:hypothetical protein
LFARKAGSSIFDISCCFCKNKQKASSSACADFDFEVCLRFFAFLAESESLSEGEDRVRLDERRDVGDAGGRRAFADF